jgi:hypothetical protein
VGAVPLRRAGRRPARRRGEPTRAVGARDEFERWAGEQTRRDLKEPFTYVVGVDGLLRLAPRRSEHVACSGGGDVLGAGEVGFAGPGVGWAVRYVSNQSTGYCPDTSSWAAVAAALDRAGIRRPEAFTVVLVYRWCGGCSGLNVVRNGDFTCALCDTAL